MAGNSEKNTLVNAVDTLIAETHKLLSETIDATKSSDDRAKRRKINWQERHRLHVLLEAAEDTRANLPDGLVAPWFLAELYATLDVVRRWCQKPIWKEIEPSLQNPTHFKHTILKLHVAEHLMKGGHDVEICPKGENASPDLIFRAIGGTQELVHVECYQPGVLCGIPMDISTDKAQNIVRKSMEKAKRQLGNRGPGILAICGYNQSHQSLATLRQVAQARLQRTSRPNLCGIWFVMLGVVLRADKDTISFTPTRTAHFVQNPSYFGDVHIDAKVPADDPQLLREPLVDISSDSLSSGDISKLAIFTSQPSVPCVPSLPTEATATPPVRRKELTCIEKPRDLTRAVVHGAGSKVPPLFVGEGNVDYVCGQCGAILARNVWDLSISNIVVECPTCSSYNEFPRISQTGCSKVQLKKGNFNLSDAVRLERAKCIEAQQ